jgi:hypothetical protein
MVDWDIISAIAESISALAVIISLVYVGTQIRQNTTASKAATIQRWAETSAIEKQAIFESREFAELIARGMTDPGSWDGTDRLRVNLWLVQFFNTFEFLYLQLLLGTIDKTFFESKLPAYTRFLQHRFVREFWDSELSTFDPRFKSYVEMELLKRDP